MARIDAVPREVAPGYWVTAPNLTGEVEAHPAGPPGTRAPTIEQPTDALITALEATELREVQLLEVQARTTRPGGVTRGAPPSDAVDTLTLDVPDLGDTVGQVVMAIHPGGAITWHAPIAGSGRDDGPVRRGGADRTRFVIPVPEASVTPESDGDPDGEGTQRGLIGKAAGTLLKVLVFPLLEDAAGRMVRSMAGRWEARNRPPRLRWYGPGDDRADGADLDGEGLRRLREGRGLLFVHGTFSTAAAGFGQLPDDLVGDLQHRYGGRMVALEHPSMSVDPVDNVAWLAELLGDGDPVELDVVTHSRGGLVGRCLAGQAGPVPGIQVGTLVYGATPNHGTPLADPEHVGEFLDRMTSLLNLVPTGPGVVIEVVLEALLTAVKATVVGGISELPGISAMDPRGPWLERVARAQSRGPVQRGIAADFEPTGALSVAFRQRVKDGVVDRVMGDVPNDMVVPTAGVSGSAMDPQSVVEDPLVYASQDGVHHSSIFAQRRTHEALREWLAG